VTRRPFCDLVSILTIFAVEEVIPYPVTSGLGDIFTDLLGRETKGTDLRGKRRGGTDLTSGGAEVNDLLLVGV